ncbi:hypothetical protein PTMSG1_03734 [Pyrenophora teres f. maculata]|nr:hypothetical protein PTMSG1_03734 [Pyrenophora teres f. maculata]
MERTIIIIGSLVVVTMLLTLTIVAVPGLKERIVKLASRSFRRSQDPLLPVVQPPQAQPDETEVKTAQAQPNVTIVETVQAQPDVTETPGQEKSFMQRQVDALRDTWTNPTGVTVPPEAHHTTHDLNRQKFRQKYLARSPGKDARQDELHRKARQGFKPNPNYRYY